MSHRRKRGGLPLKTVAIVGGLAWLAMGGVQHAKQAPKVVGELAPDGLRQRDAGSARRSEWKLRLERAVDSLHAIFARR